jgi:hypothetical protein
MTETIMWTCENCGATFGIENVVCDGKHRHVVAEKTYFLRGAPQQYGREYDGKPLPTIDKTYVTNIPPPSWELGADEHDGGTVVFENGRFSTSDPVEQYWLDLRGGWCTEAEWEAARLSPAEREARDIERRKASIATLEAEIAELKRSAAR